MNLWSALGYKLTILQSRQRKRVAVDTHHYIVVIIHTKLQINTDNLSNVKGTVPHLQ